MAPQVYYAPLIILAEGFSGSPRGSLTIQMLWITSPGRCGYDDSVGRMPESGARLRRLEAPLMRAKLIIFPYEDGFNVAVWGAWTEGSDAGTQFRQPHRQ